MTRRRNHFEGSFFFFCLKILNDRLNDGFSRSYCIFLSSLCLSSIFYASWLFSSLCFFCVCYCMCICVSERRKRGENEKDDDDDDVIVVFGVVGSEARSGLTLLLQLTRPSTYRKLSPRRNSHYEGELRLVKVPLPASHGVVP